MKTVSVIMSVHNGEKVVKRAIDSVINQTYKDIELIVVNDGSNDGTKNIIDESARRDNRIYAIHKENAGVSNARNTGIDISSGKYIMFIDSDDQYELDMVEKMLNKIEENSYDLVCCGFKNIVYNSNDKIIKVTNSKKLNIDYKNRNDLLQRIDSFMGTWLFNPLWNKIYRADVIRDNKIKMDESSDMGEDYCFNIDYISRCNTVCVFDETLYKYTLSKECLTTKFRVNEFERRKPNLIKLENFYDSNNISKNRLYFEYIMMSYSCFSHLFRKENKNTRKENLGYIASIINSESVTNSLREFNSSSFGEVIAAKILKSKNKRLIYFVSYILYVITKRY